MEYDQVGQATREELIRQKEQLRATETRLDDINATLKQSELRAEAIRNILSGIRAHMARGRQAHQQAAAEAAAQAQAAARAQQRQAAAQARLPGQLQTVAMRQQQMRQMQMQQRGMMLAPAAVTPPPPGVVVRRGGPPASMLPPAQPRPRAAAPNKKL